MLLLGPIEVPDDPSREDLERLSREAGVPLDRLVALSNKRDPFLAGTPADERDAAWFVGFVTGRNSDTHLRDLHYQLLNDGTSGYDGDWARLLVGSNKARDMGLIVPWAFPDRRTRLLVREDRPGEAIEYTIEKPYFRPGQEVYRTDVSLNGQTPQPVRAIVLIEKESDLLLGEIVGSCRRFGAELRMTIGFTPKTLAARLCEEAVADERPLVVFTITDADSKGEHMAIVTARHVEHIRSRYEIPPVYLDRIALTLEQVAEIEKEIGKEIPPAPDQSEREEGRIELNALPIFAPGWLGRQVEAALASVTVEIEKPDVEDVVPEELAEALDRAEALCERLYERIEDKLDRIEQIVDDALDQWTPDEIEVETPTVEDLDLDRDWILDPERSYLDQLNAYRRHGVAHHDTSPLVLDERLCACGCGESIAHLAVQARYLNQTHARRAARRRA